MRRIIFIATFLLLVAADAFCQDYYSDKTRVKGDHIEYNVTKKEFTSTIIIELEDTCNVLSGQWPYDNAKGQYYNFANHPWPLPRPDEKILETIVDSVFSADEKDRYSNSGKHFHLAAEFKVDPQTCRLIEVVFVLEYSLDDKRMLSIPISKIEQLEVAMKRDLIFQVPERGKDADFLFVAVHAF